MGAASAANRLAERGFGCGDRWVTKPDSYPDLGQHDFTQTHLAVDVDASPSLSTSDLADEEPDQQKAQHDGRQSAEVHQRRGAVPVQLSSEVAVQRGECRPSEGTVEPRVETGQDRNDDQLTPADQAVTQ